ncbi:c2h2-type domain-containing protein [Citrus sinensis]|uniref:C2h2-type domain-containing protein n=1 Tax=Citrus sinensis TaxID=2711 RepID=A0ACB8P788_CITSI|nr:c2h2-type domain-containing protein [Citrus sinensis]
MDPNFMHNPRDFNTIQREIEKERIRHEIITAENLRRRLLEEEVRRELMMEREMARASEMGLSMDERLSMQLHSRYPLMHQLNNRWLEDRFPFPGSRGMGFGHDVLPRTLPQFSDAMKDEIRNALEVNKKDKLIMLNSFQSGAKVRGHPLWTSVIFILILMKLGDKFVWECIWTHYLDLVPNMLAFGYEHWSKFTFSVWLHLNGVFSNYELMLAKPDPNLCGSKRKASTPPAASVELPLMSSKKTKEWSCALCQVSATSERGLDEHLQGKKHKAKEAGLLRAQKMCNNSISSMSKKSGKKKIKLRESKDSSGQEMKTDVEEESTEVNKAVVGSERKAEVVEDSEIKNEGLPKKDLTAKTRKKKNGIPTAEKTKRKPPLRKKFKFWCEDCQVGTHSAVVMEGHKRGKKHIARSNESKKNDDAVPATSSMTIVAPPDPTEKAEDEDVVAEEPNEKTTGCVTEKDEDEEVVAKKAKKEMAENVTGDSNGTRPSIVADVVDLMQKTP